MLGLIALPNEPPEPLAMPRTITNNTAKYSEFIELLVDRDPEVILLRSKLMSAQERFNECDRHLYSRDPLHAQARLDLNYAKGNWQQRRNKVRAAIVEMLSEPNGWDIVLKLYGDKKP